MVAQGSLMTEKPAPEELLSKDKSESEGGVQIIPTSLNANEPQDFSLNDNVPPSESNPGLFLWSIKPWAN